MIQHPDPPVLWYCGECGQENTEDDEYCTQCHTPREETEE